VQYKAENLPIVENGNRRIKMRHYFLYGSKILWQHQQTEREESNLDPKINSLKINNNVIKKIV